MATPIPILTPGRYCHTALEVWGSSSLNEGTPPACGSPPAYLLLDFMHSHGLCHGDFRPSNILFKTTLEDLTEEEMKTFLPDPHTHEIVAVAQGKPGEPACGPHAPLYAIEPLKLYLLHDECITKEIAIIDFGAALKAANLASPKAIPDKYFAPECQHALGSQRLSIGSDLWALGCIMMEVLCGETPFEYVGPFNF